MANSIIIKSSPTPGKVPTVGQLALGELALNTNDGLLYFKKNVGGTETIVNVLKDGLAPATSSVLGGVKGFSNLTIAGDGALSLTGANVSAALSYTPASTISPNFTGTPTAPTASANTNTTQIATTAFVLGQAATVNPLMDGSVAVGTSTRFAREDHIHPTDTSRAPLASPSFTGTPQVPTAPNGTNTQQIASTAYVLAVRLNQLQPPNGDVALNNFRLTGVAEPTSANDAATKSYVDNAAQGLVPKDPVVAASNANVTLSGIQTIDGVVTSAGDRVLIKANTNQAENGVYIVAAGAWSRSTDMNTWAKLVSAYVYVSGGTLAGGNGYVCNVTSGGTLETTPVTWAQFSGAGVITAGDGLTKTGNVLSAVAYTGIAVSSSGIALAGQALAVHNLGTNGLFARTGSGTVAARTISRTGTGISIVNGDGVSGNPTLSLTAAAEAVANVTPATDTVPYFTSTSAANVTSLTAFGRSLIGAADQSAGRTALGLGSMALQNSSSVTITGGSITNLSTFDGVTIDGGTY